MEHVAVDRRFVANSVINSAWTDDRRLLIALTMQL